MKYLLIAALASFLFVLLYTRVRPYLEAIRKVITFLNGTSNSSAGRSQRNGGLERKLVRCASCGTWVPADRALNLSSGLATYCSRECLEKKSEMGERKKAG